MERDPEELGTIGALTLGPYEPGTRASYQALCLTRRRCAFDRVSGPLTFRRYDGVIFRYSYVECGSDIA
jgi:hypothetical protein